MSLLDAITRSALTVQMGQAASAIEYCEPGGEAETLSALVGPKSVEESDTQDGKKVNEVRTVTVTTDTETGGRASISTAATVTIEDVVYSVERIVAETPTSIQFRAVRPAHRQISKPSYRRDR